MFAEAKQENSGQVHVPAAEAFKAADFWDISFRTSVTSSFDEVTLTSVGMHKCPTSVFSPFLNRRGVMSLYSDTKSMAELPRSLTLQHESISV